MTLETFSRQLLAQLIIDLQGVPTLRTFWDLEKTVLHEILVSGTVGESPTKGTFIKDVRFFLQFSEIPTYLCPIGYVLSTYVLCPIFLDIPTYPKIGHPLCTFP